MNSIANMAKKTPKPTKESRILEAAINGSGMTKEAIAAVIGVSPGMVSQWSSGYRPVAPERAAALARAVGLDDPASISHGYAETVSSGSAALKLDQVDNEAPTDLAIARLQNDVHALTMAIGSLTAVMVAHRPAEAQAVGAALRRNVPAKFRDQGMIRELLSVLDRAG